ncbi:hypothetical protein C7974DRAFT_58335 [Boeremia exigua]|uniref:uncharacterized protein n=1 Tax=Boeremia exigua TaxID=749465 RepID=UPI001E8CE4FF|nr:uncharacterized protein C7974DRAFT_58335 [Boeremia exigua]KAH6615066.1 hypothetical protein C7974DRAFT_58335 [Boeremia exigua]
MDPWRNAALQNAKIQTFLSSARDSAHSNTNQDSPEDHSDMPAPPAYHMVVDPEAHTSNMSSPYDPESEDEREDSEDDAPEITINATTQIRGSGNIISIAQMDSVRIAGLIATIVSGDPAHSEPTSSETSTPPPQVPVTNLSSNSNRTGRKKKGGLNVNITVNCGATIIGDRNIVGPGLGDIARQMQLAQRNAAMQAHQQQQQTQILQQQKLAQGLAQAQAQKQSQMNLQHSLERSEAVPGLAHCHQNLYQSQAGLVGIGQVTGQITPPMSRSGSFGSEGSPKGKRKAEDDAGEGLLMLKRRC